MKTIRLFLDGQVHEIEAPEKTRLRKKTSDDEADTLQIGRIFLDELAVYNAAKSHLHGLRLVTTYAQVVHR